MIWALNHYDPELEDSKPIFLHDTLVHDVTSPYQVWLQKGWAVEEILSKWTFTRILNVFCVLDLDHKSNPIFLHDNPAYDDAPSNQFCCKRTSSSDDIFTKPYLIKWSFTVTLTLKTANQYFWKTIWLMLMHYRIRFSISEDSIWINGHWQFAILQRPWPWIQQYNFFIRHSGLW